MRIRGGMDNPKDDDKTDEIAALKNKRFFWDGLPRIDFNEAILQPLENGQLLLWSKAGVFWMLVSNVMLEVCWHHELHQLTIMFLSHVYA